VPSFRKAQPVALTPKKLVRGQIGLAVPRQEKWNRLRDLVRRGFQAVSEGQKVTFYFSDYWQWLHHLPFSLLVRPQRILFLLFALVLSRLSGKDFT